MKDKRGFMNSLGPMAIAIVTLAIIVAVGLTVFSGLQSATSNCASGYTYNTTSQCWNGTASLPYSSASGLFSTAAGYLGTSSGGIASWIPAVIAIIIGLLIIAGFSGKRKY